MPADVPDPTVDTQKRCSDTLRRYELLVIFAVTSAANGYCFMSSGSISDVIEQYFDVTPFATNMLGQVFYATFAIFLLPGLWLAARPNGFRQAMLVGTGLNTLGAIVRAPSTVVGGKLGFWLLGLGNVLCSISSPFWLPVTTMIPDRYFPMRERSSAVALANLANQVGVALGYALPRALVKSATGESAKKMLLLLNVAPAVICVVFAIAAFMRFHDRDEREGAAAIDAGSALVKPLIDCVAEEEKELESAQRGLVRSSSYTSFRRQSVESSPQASGRRAQFGAAPAPELFGDDSDRNNSGGDGSAMEFHTTTRAAPMSSIASIGRTARELLCNPQVVVVTSAFGWCTAIYWSLGLLLDKMLLGRVSTADIALAGTLLMSSGIVSMWLQGLLADRYPRYRLWVGGGLGVAALSMAAFTAVLASPDDVVALTGISQSSARAFLPLFPSAHCSSEEETCSSSPTSIYIVSALLGTLLPITQPSLIEIAIEYSHPLPVELLTQFMFCFTQCVGFALPFISEVAASLVGALGHCDGSGGGNPSAANRTNHSESAGGGGAPDVPCRGGGILLTNMFFTVFIAAHAIVFPFVATSVYKRSAAAALATNLEGAEL